MVPTPCSRSLVLLVVLVACGDGDPVAPDGGVHDAAIDMAPPDANVCAARMLHPGPCVTEADLDADGSVDQRTTYTRDAAGRELVLERRTQPAGVLTFRVTTAWDDTDGSRIVVTDRNGDGVPDERSYLRVDQAGQTLDERTDANADGQWDTRCVIYQRNAAGSTTRVERDQNCDGVPNFVSQFTYDAQGRMTGYTHDMDGDGDVDQTGTMTYSADGLVNYNAYDDTGDGIPDRTNEITWSADRRSSRTESDDNGDGVIDVIDVATYDTSGNLVHRLEDRDADGDTEIETTVTYDANGNVASQLTVDHREIPPAGYYEEYMLELCGAYLGLRRDEDHDGNWELVYERVVDDQGNPTSYRLDSDGNGAWNLIETYSYECLGGP